jgi:hypothetical protein
VSIANCSKAKTDSFVASGIITIINEKFIKPYLIIAE